MISGEKENFTPDWAKDAVWYQIFPERFRNGDPANDPTLESIRGSYPHDNDSPWHVHPWTSDWYELQPYEKENGQDIWFNLQRRRYGGDIQGILDKLDYIKDLGINALYLNPVFQSPSLHKYDGATYHHIDPFLGPDPEGDLKLIDSEVPHKPETWVWTSADRLFLKLVQEVHSKGMRIIIDGVFNHMGLNSWVFRDIKENGKNSAYADWMKIKSWNDKEAGTRFEYEGWYGVKELPELKQLNGDIAPGPKKYIFDITKRWMDPDGDGDPADGIDGCRLDVAFMVGHTFWKDWRRHLKAINPQAYITAEIIESVDYNKPFLQGDEFDAVMNYNFAFLAEEFFINRKDKLSVSEFDDKLKFLRNAYDKSVSYVMQNLYDSHDTNRLLSHIINGDVGDYRDWGKYYNLSKGSNPDYSVKAPGSADLLLQKLMVLFQMTYVGAPMIYYGDEAGMWGANDPCCRKPMIWHDLNYADEKFNPNQSCREADKVEYNSVLADKYRKLIALRNSEPALRRGDFRTVLKDDNNAVFAYARTYGKDEIIIVINNSAEEKETDIETDGHSDYQSLLSGKIYKSSVVGVQIKLSALSGEILKALK